MIRYYSEDINFEFKGKLLNNRWIKFVAESEVRKVGDINIIFCSDNYILDVNMKYLQHDYFTDIITFDYCEDDILSGDLFISIDSVRDNASFYGRIFAKSTITPIRKRRSCVPRKIIICLSVRLSAE